MSQSKWIITATVMTGTLVASINASSVNVALPHMQGNLGASTEEIAWVSTGYILSNVIIMPLVAWFSSRYGRKRFYMASILLFILSSILCGLAWNLFSIVAFRVLQGMGGGTLIPVAQAILRETFPPEEQGQAMGIYGFGVVLGPAFGPTLGGWVIDHYSWPWVFYINIPVGILTLILASRFIQDPPYLIREKGKIDFLGLALMIVGLGALQFLLERGEVNDWFASRFILSLAAVSLVGLGLFTIRELRAERPAVNLRLLRNVTFASGNILGGVLGLGLFGGLFLLPMFLQKLLGFSALDSGLAIMPRSVAMALAMPVVGWLYNAIGPKRLVGFGFFIIALSFWQLSRLALGVGYWDIFFPQTLQGVGFGMVFVALSTACLSTISKPDMTAATGLYNFFRQITGSIGIAVSASLLTRGGNHYRALLVEGITDYRDRTHAWMQTITGILNHQGIEPSTVHQKTLGLLDKVITQQATMLSFNHVHFLIACIFIAVIPFVFLLRTEEVSLGNHSGGAAKQGE
ncbi:MAG: DHA2 family efflux MFS transporter permease subunit [Deltaproteobacteria bacterium]|nr:DHA2 family efflux MFS transporter permease subunit [Deltaproteobacteria bacterium]